MGARPGRPRLPAGLEYVFWAGVRAGRWREDAAAAAGVSHSKADRWFRERGGVMPASSAGSRTRSLSFAEREELGLLRAGGAGVRSIARAIGRDPSTVSRELRRIG